MKWNETGYGIVRRVSGRSFSDVVADARAALAAEGFGVLTEIDVQATLDAKIGVKTEPYLILGACSPKLAHQALSAEGGIGLLLPCNVVVAEDGDEVVVAAVDPVQQFQVVGRPEVEPVAEEVRARLTRAVDTVAGKVAGTA